ncbi:helix-turn-helix domain-containing protein [Thioclava kandeliae]|uniref:LysR family transcriptional regulator n=1 Tax=Thioclava kandeliae TaxID=3070818 RepID=A0ABV1SJD9_9RHOB
MSQPLLSRQIQLLEHAMGVTLFDRSKWQVMQTPASANLDRVPRGGVAQVAIGFLSKVGLLDSI